MNLFEEFKLYENMWKPLNEWKTMSPSQNNTSSTNNTSTSTNTNNSSTTTTTQTQSTQSKQEILGCDLDYYIDHMSNHNRVPRLPLFWFVDDIDDTDTDSRIMFSHRKLPLGVQFWAKYYYEDGNWSNCYYKFSWEISMDGNTWEHAEETSRTAPEDFISRLFEIVNDFDKLFNDSRANGFNDLKKRLKAAGYK
jgi:hypothetical protein